MMIRWDRAALLALPLTVMAFSGSASAAEGKGFYGALGAGGVFAKDADNEGTGLSTLDFDSEYDPGFGVLGAIGYDWGAGWRTEGEVAYRRFDLDEVEIANDGGLGALAGVGSLNGFSGNAGGHQDVISVMSNLLYDVELTSASKWKPYVGGGIGWANINLDKVRAGGAVLANDGANAFAYQAIAGVSYDVTDQLSLFGDYRFFGTSEPEFHDAVGNEFDGELRTHNVFVGLRWYFNPPPKPVPVAAPAPATPQPPVAPTPPAAAEPIPTFMVFFDWDKADIRPDAAQILDDAVAAVQRHGVTRLVLTGHADTSGPAAYNMRLSERRALAVRTYMQGKGLTDVTYQIVPKGETALLTPTPNGVREPRNRRVEIVLGR